jgi:predicted DNA-binding transcriptional regulator AlpA
LTIAFFQGRHNLDRRALDLIEAANKGTDDELMSTPEVAAWLGVSPQWLEIGRSKGRWGPPYLRLSPRRVRYNRGAVKKWLAERAHRSTAEYRGRDDAR